MSMVSFLLTIGPAPVIHQCALERDLELFEAGDATEVGERGLTLRSGALSMSFKRECPLMA